MTEQDRDKPFQQEVRLLPDHRAAKILFSISLAVLGGFLGGVITNYGPTYLNVHVAQPVLQEPIRQERIVYVPTTNQDEPNEKDSTIDGLVPATSMQSRLVIHSGKSQYILIEANANSQWGMLAIEKKTDGILNTLSQPIDPQFAPPELTQWESQTVNLYDRKGFACSATVGPLLLWQQVADDVEGSDTAVPWHDPSRLFIAAKLKATQGTCKDTVWARDARLPAPALARKTKVPKALRIQAKKAFRNAVLYKKYQSEFKKDGHKGFWDQFEFDSVRISRFVGPKQEVLAISASVGGCGDFSADFEQLYEVGKNNSLTPIPHDEFTLGDIMAAADFDDDGDIDFVTNSDVLDSMIVTQDIELQQTFRNTIDYYFCRC